MSYTQLVNPNLEASSNPGWCLAFVQKVFGAPIAHNSATEAWNATTAKHQDRNLPNVSVPVWFSWYGDLNDGQGIVDWGHVCAYIPGHGLLSSPKNWSDGPGHAWYTSIEDVENFLGAKFVGWSEDLNGLQIVSYVEDAAVPTPEPAPAPAAQTYTVVEGDTLWDIAGRFYNDNNRWPDIYNANVDVIGVDPNLIFPGQVLVIP
jgi:hypothetical protein